MQRQDNVPFLCHPSIFMAVARYLTPASLKNLEQTSRLSRARVETFLNDPTQVLMLLGSFTREQSAQFFHLYRHYLGVSVNIRLHDHPDHHAAYTLYAMMCVVKPDMLDVNRLSEAVAYLEENHFPERVRDSLVFLISFLWAMPADKFKQLFEPSQEFYINLRAANLSDTVLTDCDMRGADLRGATIFDADLRRADLSYADLTKAEVTCANLENANLIGANLQQIKEELGFPHEPCLKNAAFFPARNMIAVQKTLDRFHQMRDIPDFMIDAIAEDFTQAHRETSADEQLVMLEAGMQDPLFATHSESMIAFINRRLFTIFTNSQTKISQQIVAVKLVKELEEEAAEPVLKKSK